MSRIEREKRVVSQMLTLYCRAHHGPQPLCPDCRELQAYAWRRLERCRFGEAKTACQHCPLHCYAPARREAIRRVMRYAGPRMLFRHPLAALRHLLDL